MSIVGKKVQHTKFGTGTIENIDESYVEVKFDEGIYVCCYGLTRHYMKLDGI